jgi:hypothetical protein
MVGRTEMSSSNGSDVSPDRPFDEHQFYLDFTRQLRRMRHPYFRRRIAYVNGSNDDSLSQRQSFQFVSHFEEADMLALDGRVASCKQRHTAGAVAT